MGRGNEPTLVGDVAAERNQRYYRAGVGRPPKDLWEGSTAEQNP